MADTKPTQRILPIRQCDVSPSSVRLRCADNPDPALATQSIDMTVSYGKLTTPSASDKPLGPPELQYLGEVQLAALLYARSAINIEIQRLRDFERQTLESSA
jgi:hypothetical protein